MAKGESRKKEMPFAFSAVNELYYSTQKKLRSAIAKVKFLESELERYTKAKLEFGGELNNG